MTQCAALNLKEITVPDPNPNKDLPKQYHERTGHVLQAEKNPIQVEVDKLKHYAKENKMVINESKTKVMIFNPARKIDILPQIEISEGNYIEVVEETKLLGLIVRSDLKWQSNTENIVKKSYMRMWILRNLKRYGAEEQQLIDTYIQQIRSIAEMACPVWNAGLTQQEERGLERIQKTAFAIIRGDEHTNYKEALEHFGMETLSARREILCLRFALKAYRNPKFTTWFATNQSEVNTRSTKPPIKEVRTRTRRFKNSPIPYLTELLNQHLFKQKNLG